MNTRTFVKNTFALMDELFDQSTGFVPFFTGLHVVAEGSNKPKLTSPKTYWMSNNARSSELLRKLFAQDRDGRDVYMAPVLYRTKSRKAANALPMLALYADGDGALVPANLPQPSIALESSPARHHYFWLLEEPLNVQAALDLNIRITAAIGADPSGTDLAQLLRLPGTHNHKYADAPEVLLVVSVASGGPMYAAADLEKEFPASNTPRKTSSRKAVGGARAPVRLRGEDLAAWHGNLARVTPDGRVDRSASLFDLARRLKRRGADHDQVFDALEERDVALGWSKYADCPDGEDRYEDIIAAVFREGDSPASRAAGELGILTDDGFPATDVGMAERLASRSGDDSKFSPGAGWRVWDDRRFIADKAAAELRAMENARALSFEAAGAPTAAVRQELQRFVRRAESSGGVQAQLDLARSLPPICQTDDAFDAHPMKLNVANGILDLGTGTLADHVRSELHTKLVPVDWDPTATCRNFDAFVNKIFDGNKALVSYVQRVAGYCLTASCKEDAFFVFVGTGANGKTTLLRTLQSILGDYSQQMPAESLLQRPTGSVRNDIARLVGSRFVVASEINEGQFLDEALVKQLTGRDCITARLLYRENIEFDPTFKVVVATNKKPAIRGTDNGIWRRIHLVPFDVTIPTSEQDHSLGDKLAAEMPGILAWAVRGCLSWQRHGLRPPPAVLEATNEYRIENDVIARFVAERCQVGPGRTSSERLWSDYTMWCLANDVRELSKPRWHEEMRGHGYLPFNDGKKRGYEGIRLRGGDSIRAA